MRVGILGSLEVHDGERAVDVAGTRLRALLIRLALDPGSAGGLPALAEALWDGVMPADTANAVQTLVSRLRRSAPAPFPVVRRGRSRPVRSSCRTA